MDTFGKYRSQPDFGCNLSDGYNPFLIVLGRHRDSPILDEVNWDVGLAMLGGESAEEDGDENVTGDVAILRFNHWAVGWVEVLMVRPGTPAAVIAEDIRRRLDDYPILNEEKFSEAEYSEYLSSWESYGYREFVKEVRSWFDEAGCERALDWLDDVPTSPELLEWYESLISEPYTAESSGVHLSIKPAVESLDRPQLAKFIRKVRAARRATPAVA